jgi:hypothetical protein
MPVPTRPIALCLALALLACGCAEAPPRLTEVEGTVLLDNKPLPQALVRFVPEASGPGAALIATGVTDDQGHFRLTCDMKNEPGAVVGKNRVVVIDAPPPAEARGPSGKAQEAAARYLAGLKMKNRPIPQAYSTAAKTPVTVEVKQEQKDYTIKLTR